MIEAVGDDPQGQRLGAVNRCARVCPYANTPGPESSGTSASQRPSSSCSTSIDSLTVSFPAGNFIQIGILNEYNSARIPQQGWQVKATVLEFTGVSP